MNRRVVRGCLVTVATTPLLLGAAACGGGSTSTTSSTSPSASPTPTPGHDSPADAMAGLLAAMNTQQNRDVLGWLPPTPATDRNSLESTAEEASAFGGNQLLWEVAGRRITGVSEATSSGADITLDGHIVWCLASSLTDPKASCAQPDGVGGQTTTYPAVNIQGQWYIDMDINKGHLISGNPGPSGVPASPTAPSS